MSSKTALKIVLILSLAGLLFSGYLSYMELFRGGCEDALVKCSVGEKPVVDLGTLPACVYGFFMYLIILIITIAGLMGKRQSPKTPEDTTKTETENLSQ